MKGRRADEVLKVEFGGIVESVLEIGAVRGVIGCWKEC